VIVICVCIVMSVIIVICIKGRSPWHLTFIGKLMLTPEPGRLLGQLYLTACCLSSINNVHQRSSGHLALTRQKH
jgi:hypothetical protein